MLAFALVLTGPLFADYVEPGEAYGVAEKVQQAEAEREPLAGEVVSTRRYVLRNSRWQEPAVMDARMISTPGKGKRFEVVSMENAGNLQKRIFMQILEGEVSVSAKRLSTKGTETDNSLSVNNYDFAVLGTETVEGRHCIVLKLIPKRQDKYLISGKAWVDPEAAAIVRVEGHTAASISFWIGKPAVSQSFRQVEGVWLPSANRSVSNVRYLGNTELAIDYVHYTIKAPDVAVARMYDKARRKNQ